MNKEQINTKYSGITKNSKNKEEAKGAKTKSDNTICWSSWEPTSTMYCCRRCKMSDYEGSTWCELNSGKKNCLIVF